MKIILLSVLALALVATVLLWARYGGGTPYPDLSTAPVLNAAALEEVLSYSEPVGNVAVNREARRVLEAHESVAAEDYVIRNNGRDMEFLGGIMALRGGIDGIALGPKWLYYGAISGSGLYRVRLRDLRDRSLLPGQLANRVERVSDKPLSDGMSIDVEGNVYITDKEHNSIFIAGPGRVLRTLIRTPEVRWPDALSFGPDGYLYVADSALAELILQSREHIEASGPYRIFRLQTGKAGNPGQ